MRKYIRSSTCRPTAVAGMRCPLHGSRLPRLKQGGTNRPRRRSPRGRSAEALASFSPLPGGWDAAAGCALPQGEPQGRWDRQERVVQPRSTSSTVPRPAQSPTKLLVGLDRAQLRSGAFKLARLYSSVAPLPPCTPGELQGVGSSSSGESPPLHSRGGRSTTTAAAARGHRPIGRCHCHLAVV